MTFDYKLISFILNTRCLKLVLIDHVVELLQLDLYVIRDAQYPFYQRSTVFLYLGLQKT